ASRRTKSIRGMASAACVPTASLRQPPPWECIEMLKLPVLRWGQPYESLEFDQVTHFATGEPIAQVGRANAGMVQRDMRKAQSARDALTAIDIEDLIGRIVRAGDIYMKATLPMGDGTQTPDEFVRAQSASTGLPERLCRMN